MPRHFSYEIKFRTFERQNFKCNCCRRPLENNEYEFDHIVAVADGGPNDLSNCQALCLFCHRTRTAEQGQERNVARRVILEMATLRDEMMGRLDQMLTTMHTPQATAALPEVESPTAEVEMSESPVLSIIDQLLVLALEQSNNSREPFKLIVPPDMIPLGNNGGTIRSLFWDGRHDSSYPMFLEKVIERDDAWTQAARSAAYTSVHVRFTEAGLARARAIRVDFV